VTVGAARDGTRFAARVSMATRTQAIKADARTGTLSSLSFVAALTALGCNASDTTPTEPNQPSTPPASTNPLMSPEAGACRGTALPSDQAFVADGMCVRAVALAQGQLRQLTFSDDGDLIGVTSDGRILRYRDVNDDGTFLGGDEVVQIASTGGKNGNNAAFEPGDAFLYAGTPTGVKRWRYAARLDDLGPGQDVVIGQPSSGTHKLHTVHVFDGWLYVHSGSEGNAFHPALPEYDTERSVLKRFPLTEYDGRPFAWGDGEVYHSGLRNMVGFTRNPADGALYGVVNGLDDLVYQGEDVHLDNPGEDLVRLDQGKAHGYPYCFTAQNIPDGDGMTPAGTQLASDVAVREGEPAFTNPHDDAWCAENSTQPVTFFPAHSAPLDILFLSGATALPAEWEGSALVALHGSWDTSPSVGHQVVRISLGTEDGEAMPTATMDGARFDHEVIFGGTRGDGLWGWASGSSGEYPVRPVGIAVSPTDGALYVSSDNASVYQGVQAAEQGAIYRIARVAR
jgi:glucose/arabinose dehydrogenase